MWVIFKREKSAKTPFSLATVARSWEADIVPTPTLLYSKMVLKILLKPKRKQRGIGWARNLQIMPERNCSFDFDSCNFIQIWVRMLPKPKKSMFVQKFSANSWSLSSCHKIIEIFLLVITSMIWEDAFYAKGKDATSKCLLEFQFIE